MYGQYPPLVNASRPPGEWQSYDIVFTAPRFGANGTLSAPAIVTVVHNGVLVHDARRSGGPRSTSESTRTSRRTRAARFDSRITESRALPEHLGEGAAQAG